MGTKLQSKSCLPGYYSMRDMNEDSNSSSWPLFYSDKALPNGQYYNGFMPRTVTDAYPGYDKDALKQKMLEHEAIFKNQVNELHRLYRIQRDMMEEFRQKELHKRHISIDTSSSSSFLASQVPSEDARKWHIPSFPLPNSGCARPSMLGAEIINSPLSCTKGYNPQAAPVPPQNGWTSKDCEILESRPSKVRKKLFDLELPADEYTDTEEGGILQENKMSDSSIYHPNGRNAPERTVKMFLGNGKSDVPRDTSTSNSIFRSSLGFADLNAPVQVEAAAGPTSVDFLGLSDCHGETRGLDLAAKPNLPFLGLPREFVPKFQHGSDNGTSSNRSVENKGNGREWLSNMREAGNSKSNLNCIPQSLQPDKLPILSHPNGLISNKAHLPLGIFTTDNNRSDLQRERTDLAIEISDRTRNHCNYNHPEPVMPSRPFGNSSDLLANPWSHSVSSWGKPCGSSTQKLTSVQIHPSFNSSAGWSRNSQSCDLSREIFGDKWHVKGNSRLSPVFAGELATCNGFYHGFPSGSKELSGYFPSSGFDYPNCNKGDVSEKFFKGPNFMDLKSAKDINSNLVTNMSSNEGVSQKDLEVIDEKGKCQDRIASLPWLRAKPACKNEAAGTRNDPISVDLGFLQPSSNHLCKNGTVKGPKHVFTKDVASASSGGNVEANKEIGDNSGSRRILGFPIFENRCASKNDSPSLISPSEGENQKIEGKRRLIDINVACDPTFPESGKETSGEALIIEKETNEEVNNFRNCIDLNSCLSEDEDALAPSVPIENPVMRIAVEIDLEAPVVQESEESMLPEEEHKQHEAPLQSLQNVVEHPDDDFVRTAAEAIVAISTSSEHQHIKESASHPSEASLADPLLWFVDIVSSCAGDLDSKFGKESRDGSGGDIVEFSTSEIDYFEAMTLQLVETKEEEYMPKPLVPEIRDTEETGASSLANRTRRGQSRRGRQRRDFQRDILPGLTSLARHEVTEDLQTFGGLMRATGHTWQSGLARRKGGAARRRRRPVVELAPPAVETPVCTSLMQHLHNIEVGLEDRSLTGWGKTTRRPRRQRCPAGNPVAIALT